MLTQFVVEITEIFVYFNPVHQILITYSLLDTDERREYNGTVHQMFRPITQ